MTRHLLSTEEAAAILNLKPQTLNNWRTQGRGPVFVKQGRSVSYDPADLQSWKDANKFQNSQQAKR
jgi:hypothetical protein